MWGVGGEQSVCDRGGGGGKRERVCEGGRRRRERGERECERVCMRGGGGGGERFTMVYCVRL